MINDNISEFTHDFFLMDCNCDLAQESSECTNNCLMLNCDDCEHLITDGEIYYMYESDTLCFECVKVLNFYSIDLNERGYFEASVTNWKGETVYSIESGSIFEDGFMKHTRDLDGLKSYLFELGIFSDKSELYTV